MNLIPCTLKVDECYAECIRARWAKLSMEELLKSKCIKILKVMQVDWL